jgi:hypothetical protein
VLTLLVAGSYVIYGQHIKRGRNIAEDMKRKYVLILIVCFVKSILYRISELYEAVLKTKIPAGTRSLMLEMSCDDLEGNDVEDIPYIKYTFR